MPRKNTTTQAVTYCRLLEKFEIIQAGDVAGWIKRQPVLEIWYGEKAESFNQPVFRPLAAFVDKHDLLKTL